MDLSLEHVPKSNAWEFSSRKRKQEILIHHVNRWHCASDSIEHEHEHEPEPEPVVLMRVHLTSRRSRCMKWPHDIMLQWK